LFSRVSITLPASIGYEKEREQPQPLALVVMETGLSSPEVAHGPFNRKASERSSMKILGKFSVRGRGGSVSLCTRMKS
jgi:hypothetical protein